MSYDPKKSVVKAGKGLGTLILAAAVPAILVSLADPGAVSQALGEPNWLWAVPFVNMLAMATLDWWKHRDK